MGRRLPLSMRTQKKGHPVTDGLFEVEDALCLEVVHEPHVVALAFGTVLGTAFEVGVNKQMRIL